MSQVAILGCGPAGLLAALATEQAGHDAFIFGIKQKSQMPGAIYMHEPIPDLTSKSPDGMIEFQKCGSREGYAQKVYGEGDAPCSWDEFPEGEQPGWNLVTAYDRLWDRYESEIVNEALTGEMIADGKFNWDLVISSIPAPAICIHGHDFISASIWIRSRPRVTPAEKSVIVYNGNPLDGWYRFSDIFGHMSFEFGHRVVGANQGKKPIRNNCDCHPEIVRIGRFGRWEKGVLVNHAYQEALDAVYKL